MGYCCQIMIGIEYYIGEDYDEVVSKIRDVMSNFGDCYYDAALLTDADCISKVLQAWKGDMIVIAGVFNYLNIDITFELARRISAEIKNRHVTAFCLEQDGFAFGCNVYRNGEVDDEYHLAVLKDDC